MRRCTLIPEDGGRNYWFHKFLDNGDVVIEDVKSCGVYIVKGDSIVFIDQPDEPMSPRLEIASRLMQSMMLQYMNDVVSD